MRKVITIFLAVIILTIILSGCFTAKQRLAMEEFKKQLEVAPAELNENGPLSVTPAAQPATITAMTEENEKPALTAVPAKTAIVPTAVQTQVKEIAKQENSMAKTNILLGILLFILGLLIIMFIFFIMKKRKEEIEEQDKAEFKEDKSRSVQKAETKIIENEEKQVEIQNANVMKEIKQPVVEEETEKETEKQTKEEQPVEKYEEIGDEGPVVNKPGETAFIPERPETLPANEDTKSGKARISPVQLKAGSTGNTVHVIYNVGEDSPEYRNIRITIPDNWPLPSGVAQDDGYVTAEVKGGKLISKTVEGRVITISVYGLAAITGEIIVTYGDKCEGGKGVSIPDIKGTVNFILETETEASKEIKPLEDAPSVEITE